MNDPLFIEVKPYIKRKDSNICDLGDSIAINVNQIMAIENSKVPVFQEHKNCRTAIFINGKGVKFADTIDEILNKIQIAKKANNF